jgi:hypothetical protein
MRKIQRHTKAEMFVHVEACKDIKQPQKAYCKKHGLACSTFQYWSKKYRKEFKANIGTENSPGFIPVIVQEDPKVLAQGSVVNTLHFLYPNGIQVMCPERVNPEVLKTLINP